MRNVQQVKSHKVRAAHIKNCTTSGTQTRTELDTQADTLCAGTGFLLQDITEKIYSVYPFSAIYKLMQGVHISNFLEA